MLNQMLMQSLLGEAMPYIDTPIEGPSAPETPLPKGKTPVQAALEFVPAALRGVGDKRRDAAYAARGKAAGLKLPDQPQVMGTAPRPGAALIATLLGAGLNTIDRKNLPGSQGVQGFYQGFAGERERLNQENVATYNRKLQERGIQQDVLNVDADRELSAANQAYAEAKRIEDQQAVTRRFAQAEKKWNDEMILNIGAQKAKVITDIIGSKPKTEAELMLAINSASQIPGITYSPENIQDLRNAMRESRDEDISLKSYLENKKLLKNDNVHIRSSAALEVGSILKRYPHFVGSNETDILPLVAEGQKLAGKLSARERLDIQKALTEVENREWKKASASFLKAREKVTKLDAKEQEIINKYLPGKLQAEIAQAQSAAAENLAQADKARMPASGKTLTPNEYQSNLRQANDRKTKARTTSQTLSKSNDVMEKAIADIEAGKYPLPAGTTADRMLRQLREQIEINEGIIGANDQTIADQDSYLTELKTMMNTQAAAPKQGPVQGPQQAPKLGVGQKATASGGATVQRIK